MKKRVILTILFALSLRVFAEPHVTTVTVPEKIRQVEAMGRGDSSTFLVLPVPQIESIQVATVEYRAGQLLDIYYPPAETNHAPYPVVFIVSAVNVTTLSDVVVTPRNQRWSIGWGSLFAAHGMAAVQYDTTNPAADVGNAIEFLIRNGPQLNLDVDRIAVHSASGNSGLAMKVVMDTGASYAARIRCASFVHGIIRYPYPLRRSIPMLLVFGGTDYPDVTTTCQAVVRKAQQVGIELTVIDNAPQKNFEMYVDTDESRAIILQTLGWIRTHLERDYRS